MRGERKNFKPITVTVDETTIEAIKYLRGYTNESISAIVRTALREYAREVRARIERRKQGE